MDSSIKEETCTFFIQDENFIKCNSCGAVIFCSEDMQVPKRCPYCYSVCTGTTHKGDYHLKEKLYARSLCDFINRNGLWDYQVKVQTSMVTFFGLLFVWIVASSFGGEVFIRIKL